jgi:DNA-binding CsgD family transcriptional regulator
MRERLATDYGWTHRQRQVLALLSSGKSNVEIADRLGISRDGAKYHVAEILSKLHAESREEAAEYWRLHEGLTPRFQKVFRWSAWGTPLLAGGSAVVIAIAVASAVLLARSSGNDSNPADSAPSVTPTATALPKSTATPSPTVEPAFVGTLNGFQVDPSWRGRTPLEVCPSGTMGPPPPRTEEAVTTASGPLRIDPSLLGAGAAGRGLPDAFVCDGALVQVAWPLTPPSQQGQPGPPLFVSRVRGLEPLQQPMPWSAWKTLDVAGQPAVGFENPKAPQGACWLAVYQPSSDVLTIVSAEGHTLTECVNFAAALLQRPSE